VGLGPDGIELLGASGDRMTDYMGNDVRVAVFDTSPFDVPDNGTSVEPIAWVTPLLTLTVRHPELVPAPNCPGRDRRDPCIDREKQDISNHGLFVAGLVHAVAPHSEIHLIRVLEDDGCGDLFAIGSAIDSFIEETLDEKGTLKDTVINLSLGVHQPPNPETFGLPKEVVSLQHTIQRAIEHGAVVVAAAGNDSYITPTKAISMEIPANDPPVIGVAASNTERKRGCFSNEGDIAAPGGDGINLPGGDEENSCEVPGKNPDSDAYVCQEEPGFCLISLVDKPYPGYAYWVGTSFSTPLVSGLAALMLEKERDKIISMSSANVAHTISTTIKAGACPPATPPMPHYLGAGIVNVRHTIEGSACPAHILTP
jgi:subtilisin family serine protease